MLIHQAYLCEEVRHHALADAQQKTKDTIEELQTIAHPRVRTSLDKLAEQVNDASIDQLVATMQQAMAMTQLLATIPSQVIADIYAQHWT